MTITRSWVKSSLFLSSYFPLWLIFLGLIIINPNYEIFTKPYSENLLAVTSASVFFVILIISIVVTSILLKVVKNTERPIKTIIKNRENLTGEYVLYVVTYIIPFLVNDFLAPERLFGLSVLLITIGILYVRANLLHINPLFTMLGYRLYYITNDDDKKIHVLSKQVLYEHDELNINEIEHGFYVDAKS